MVRRNKPEGGLCPVQSWPASTAVAEATVPTVPPLVTTTHTKGDTHIMASDDLMERLRTHAEIADEQGKRLDAADWRAAADRIEQLEAVVNHPIIQICIGMNGLQFPELVIEVQP